MKISILPALLAVSLLATGCISTATNPGLIRAADAATVGDLIHKNQIRASQAKIAQASAGIKVPASHFNEEAGLLQKGAIFSAGIAKQSLKKSYLAGVEKKSKK